MNQAEVITVASNPVAPEADQVATRSKRSFSDEEKLAMLREAEAPGNTIAGIARLHGLKASQLFVWRKQLQGGKRTVISVQQLDPEREYLAIQDSIAELDRLRCKFTRQLALQLDDGKTTLYNGACAVASVTGAFTRLTELRLQVVDRLNEIQSVRKLAAQEEVVESEHDIEFQREAEALCMELVRDEILKRKQEKEEDDEGDDDDY